MKARQFVFVSILTCIFLIFSSCTRNLTPYINGRALSDDESGGNKNAIVFPDVKNGHENVETGDLPSDVRSITIAAIGDIMAHEGTYGAAWNGTDYNFDYMFASIAPFLSDADYRIGNLETTFAGAERGYSSYPRFNTPEQMGRALANTLGINLLSTANNHCFDMGYSGLCSTIDRLNEYGISHVGTYRTETEADRIFMVDINGINVAFLSYTYGTNGISTGNYAFSVNIVDKDAIKNSAQKARDAGADFVIALLHWGTEYVQDETDEQHDLALWLFENTEVNLIIGNHAHVVEPIEQLTVEHNGIQKTGTVFYALGNFTSEQLKKYRNTGIAVRIKLVLDKDNPENDRVESIGYIPVFVDPNPKSSGQRYRVVSISRAVSDYEAGTDPLISQAEYQLLTEYEEYYHTKLFGGIVSEYFS